MRHGEAYKSIAYVCLYGGTTVIYSDISEDGERHSHPFLLKEHHQRQAQLKGPGTSSFLRP
jgi:hypothetical protein